ncbi:SMP-30/gluconolactonase/LRE family protein [Cohnella yongneupensis]|uniref:SMP-30/gluconolactonase/LRE family protein n=1 Tax=Cohnella yongneupensis TaxID=425006 RepID=A0ABW0R1T2_9BACL
MQKGKWKRTLLVGLIGAIGLSVLLTGEDRHSASATGYWDQWEVWGSLGTGDGQFNHPSGIAIDSEGYIYVADSGNNRIQKFDSEGRFIRKWAKPGPGKPGVDLKNPADIAFDSAGNMYVTEADGN